jgi:cleavage and polyadenylation specificity factor subunit 3
MFLEAQFGTDALTPIETPKLPSVAIPPLIQNTLTKERLNSGSDSDESSVSAAEIQELQKTEIERLHKLGIPVPGIEIKVDKMVASVWLEDLDVECTNRVFGDRVRAVVDRAVEVVAPLFQQI